MYHGNAIVILIAAGFNEPFVICATVQLRQRGLPVLLVGNVDRPVTGFNGITLQPDLALSALPAETVPALLVLPGPEQCLAPLAADPRVHELLAQVCAGSGRIMIPAETANWFDLTRERDAPWPLLSLSDTNGCDKQLFAELADTLLAQGASQR